MKLYVALLEIRWPSGAVQYLEKIAVDRLLKVREPNGQSTQVRI
jgi:hypothetical protein